MGGHVLVMPKWEEVLLDSEDERHLMFEAFRLV
jgi:hypothetical protein